MNFYIKYNYNFYIKLTSLLGTTIIKRGITYYT